MAVPKLKIDLFEVAKTGLLKYSFPNRIPFFFKLSNDKNPNDGSKMRTVEVNVQIAFLY